VISSVSASDERARTEVLRSATLTNIHRAVWITFNLTTQWRASQSQQMNSLMPWTDALLLAMQ